MSWDDARIERLTQLWRAGHSAGSIARQLGGFEHCRDGGRSAVIGKINRLGISARSCGVITRVPHKRSAKMKRKPTPPARPMMRTDGLPLPLPAADDKARISFNGLMEHHCRWPVGETTGVGLDTPIFCGLKKLPGGISSYCPTHQARASGAIPPRRPPSVAVPATLPDVRKELEAAA